MHLFNENLLHLLVIKPQKQLLMRMMRKKKENKTNSFPKYHPQWPLCSLKFPLFFFTFLILSYKDSQLKS